MSQNRKKSPLRASREKPSASTHDTRLSLMTSAQRHFSECGFKAASVHNIARDAGVNVSLVSYHFGGKEGLFKACLERAGIDRLGIAERVLQVDPISNEDVRVRLGMFVDELLLDGIRNPEICAILHRDLHSEFHLIEDVFKKTFLRTFELLSNFIDSAKKRKILADWIDPNLSAIQLVGSVIHTIRADEIRKKIFNQSIADPEILMGTRDHIVRAYLEGVAARD